MMVILRRLFVFTAILFLVIPVTWIIFEHKTEKILQHTRRLPLHYKLPQDNFQNDIEQFSIRSSNEPHPSKPGVLVVYRRRLSVRLDEVSVLFRSHRIQHDVYIFSSTLMPTLIYSVDNKLIGKYSIIIIFDVLDFLSNDSVYQLFEEYCKEYGASLMFLTNGEKWRNGKDIFYDDIKFFTLPERADKQYLRIQETKRFMYARDGGEWSWPQDNTDLVCFWPHHTPFLGGKSKPFESNTTNNRFQEIVTLHYSLNSAEDDIGTVPVALIDWSPSNDILKAFIGIPITEAIGKLAFLEALHLISVEQNKPLLLFDNKRWIQIDIDDVFFASAGFNPTAVDVQAMISAQESFQKYIPGFKFNLGFCGYRFHYGSSEEIKGSDELIANANKFNWFGHTYKHSQPHLLTLQGLIEAMNSNKKFAMDQGIPLPDSQYSVSAHHSGVYPVYEPLYTAWKQIWNISVTTTEEYPHLRPDYSRRGFIHSDIMVLPRQTCRLFTHINYFRDFIGGIKQLFLIARGGEVFNTILNHPVSIFMTHYNNYATDRLALILFDEVFKFLNRWTKLKLMVDTPVNIARKYFEIFPEDAIPLWRSPCMDKRLLQIWSKKNCTQLPSIVIAGPQKTGSTALHFFLKQHPQMLTNPSTQHAFEEVQFFSSELHYNKGIDWYMSNFPYPKNNLNFTQFVFEKSATYFNHPLTPERVHALIPQAKVIILLADPIKRAYSWYQHMISHRDPTALNNNFTTAIRAHKEIGSPRSLLTLRSHCLSPGIYHEHITRWLKYFNPAQIHFVDGEELVKNPIQVLINVNAFLGLETFHYQKLLRFSPKKGFYCISGDQGKEMCLGIGKGRKYPDISSDDLKYLGKYYSLPNRMLYKLLLHHSREPPTWLVTGFSQN